LAVDLLNDKPLLRIYARSQNPTPSNPKELVESPLSIYYDNESGWIMAQSTKLAANQHNMKICWLPVELRGRCFATYNESTIVIGSETTHKVTIIDLRPMLDMLHKLRAA
jgi:hypothetical protein